MTKPGGPPATGGGDVLEIDAMDLAEWEQDQRTPQASVANLAALVEQSARPAEPVEVAAPRKTPLVARARAAGPVVPRPPRAIDTPAGPARVARSDKITPVVLIPIARDIPPAPMVPAARTGASVLMATSAAAAPSAAPPPSAVAARTRPGAAPPPSAVIPPRAATQPSAATSPRAMAAGTGAPRARRGSSAESDPDVTPSSSRPLSAIRAGVARPGSAMGEARSAGLVDLAAASGPPPALDDLGSHAPPPPVPDAPVPGRVDAAPVALPLPLPAPVAPAPRPDPLSVPDLVTPPHEHHDRDAVGTRGRPSSSLSLSSSPSRRRWLWIGGAAGAVAMVVVLVLVLARGRQAGGVAASVPGQAPARDAVVARAALAPPVATVSAAAEPLPPPSAGSALPAPSPASSPTPGTAAIRSVPAPAKKLGGKKLVVEYGGQPGEAAMPAITAPTTDDPAIGRARSAYLHGNQQLFAGDTQGAIRAYRQALSLYPGYVGGYRGLGLAYTQLGDRPKALEAFKTYVAAVPGAKDVALIKKRIAQLSGK